jgi:hypothetical protein
VAAQLFLGFGEVMSVEAKRLLFQEVGTLLAPLGFARRGTYFQRTTRDVKQAIYFQPSRSGREYFVEVMVTFECLSSARKNTLQDAHLRARLSSYYHPDGDPTEQQEWSVRIDRVLDDARLLQAEVPQALQVFLQWLDEYPDPKTAAEKMKQWRFSLAVFSSELFADLKRPVPVPIDDRSPPWRARVMSPA